MENLIKLIKEEFEWIEKEELEELEELDLNFDWFDYIDIDWWEYRVIPENIIERIFKESVIELVEDAYLPKDLPSIIANNVDWDWIVEEFDMAWYWEHFGSYDWTEIYWHWFYLFRNN